MSASPRNKTGISNNINLRVKLLLLAITVCTSALGATESDLSCRRPESAAEKRICSDETLAKLDDQLSTLVQRTAGNLPGAIRNHFLLGNRQWMMWREEACQLADDAVSNALKVTCMQSANSHRISALEAQIKKQSRRHHPVDVDAVLDSTTDLGDVYPIQPGSDTQNYHHPASPHSCRELQVLLTAGWRYSPDTIGDAKRQHDIATCSAMILDSFGKREPSTQRYERIFGDIRRYSSRFLCLTDLPSCRDRYPDLEQTIGELEKQGELRITDGRNSKSTDSSTDTPTLILRQDGYITEDKQYFIEKVGYGDFTHSNQKQALLIFYMKPIDGTLSVYQLVIAEYDARHNRVMLANKDTTAIFP